MLHKNKSCLLFFLVNYIVVASSRPGNGGGACDQIVCVEPTPEEKKSCDFIDKIGGGTGADCCPLWKCWKRDGSLYTVHGNDFSVFRYF